MKPRHLSRWIAVPFMGLSCLVAGSPVLANPDTDQGAAQVAVVEPVQIANTSDLAFGSIVAPASGTARVTINARTGARTSNINATPLGTTGFGRGLFVVTGAPNTNVNLTVASPTIQLTGPGAPMIVDELRVNRNASAQATLPRTYLIPANGTMQIGFGGRLRFPTGQTPGSYSGTFDLTVTYQ